MFISACLSEQYGYGRITATLNKFLKTPAKAGAPHLLLKLDCVSVDCFECKGKGNQPSGPKGMTAYQHFRAGLSLLCTPDLKHACKNHREEQLSNSEEGKQADSSIRNSCTPQSYSESSVPRPNGMRKQ